TLANGNSHRVDAFIGFLGRRDSDLWDRQVGMLEAPKVNGRPKIGRDSGGDKAPRSGGEESGCPAYKKGHRVGNTVRRSRAHSKSPPGVHDGIAMKGGAMEDDRPSGWSNPTRRDFLAATGGTAAAVVVGVGAQDVGTPGAPRLPAIEGEVPI